MDRIRYTIDKNEYNALMALNTRPEQSAYIRNNIISDSIKYGYGYYGFSEIVNDDKGMAVIISIGSSCD